MSGDRLSTSEKRALALWVLLGIVGAIFAHRFYFRAFPEASVDLRVSRGEALERARNFVASLGENVSGYRTSIIFDVDDDAKTYLERQLGLQEANRLMSGELKIWYWDVRFFRPRQEEEFRVRVSPTGEIAGYERKIPEAAAGASPDRATAQTTASNFLTQKLGMNLGGWDFLPEEANSEKRPSRLDWSFTWEKRGFRAKDAPYRLNVRLQGDQPGASQRFLQVPEAWERSYRALRAGNDTLALVFTVPYIALLGVAVWLAIRLTNQGQTSWRGAIILGAFVAGLLFLQNLNDYPHWGASYDTNTSYSSFIALRIAAALLISVLSAITVTLVLPAGEPLYRASQPSRLRLSQAFTLRGLRSKEFFSAAVVGLSMAAAHIGYVVAFYVIASHFGAWAPQDLNYEDSVNTAFPWISGAAIGLLASTNEEFTFRLFAIPFFKRLTRSGWIAVILPAFMWSFLHSNYPQEPAYIRGIEIGLVGMVAGLVMLRWGIVATLIWHYTVDASLVGLLLVRSSSLYFKVSGIVVAAAAAAPLLFAGVSYLARGRFESAEDLLNEAQPAPEISLEAAVAARPAAEQARRYDALRPGTLAFLAACLIAGTTIAWRLKPQSIGDYLRLSVDAPIAKSLGDKTLGQRGIDPKSWKHATLLVNTTDPVANEFLRERVGVARTNEIHANEVPGALWHVRYFRDSQPEEYGVVLKPDGSLHSVHHQIAEAAPGAALTKDQAVALAERFLRDEKKIDLTQWSLVESESNKRPHRIDHVLTWQQNAPLDAGASATQGAGPGGTSASGTSGSGMLASGTSTSGTGTSAADTHAYARMTLVVLGDEVTDYRTFIKIPDEWRRRDTEVTLGRTAIDYGIRFMVLAGLPVAALIIFLANLRSEAAHAIPWKRISRWALWALGAYVLLIVLGDRIPTFLDRYSTAIPFKIFLGSMAIGLLLGAFFYYGSVALLLGGGWYYGTRAFGQERIPAWTGMPGAYYRDALWIGLGGAGALVGLQTLLTRAASLWPTPHRAVEASFGTDLDAIIPVASIAVTTLLHALIYSAVVGLAAGFVAAQLRRRWLRFVVFVLAALALAAGDWGNPADLVKQVAAQAILLGVIAFGVARIMRFNVLGCFLALATISLLEGIAELMPHPESFYRANAYGVILLGAMLLAWPLMGWMRARSRQEPGAAG